MTWTVKWGADVSHVRGSRLVHRRVPVTKSSESVVPALYRPVSSLPDNRLSFILDGIAHEPTRSNEDVDRERARVTRFTIAV